MILIDFVLGAAVVLLVLLVWAALKHLALGVPFVPAPRPVIEVALRELQLSSTDTLCDLGAGDGRVLIRAARLVPGLRVRGYEVVWPVWLCGRLRIACSGQTVDLRPADARLADVSGVTAVFLYLTPALLAELSPKLRSDLRSGARIVCVAFALPGFTPEKQCQVRTWRGVQLVNVYRVP